MADPFRCGDTGVVAVDGASRDWLQCADILLSDQPSRRAARRWISATLAGYPGCVVAAARDPRGRWCIVAIRGLGTLLVLASKGSAMNNRSAELFSRCGYDQWIARHRAATP